MCESRHFGKKEMKDYESEKRDRKVKDASFPPTSTIQGICQKN